MARVTVEDCIGKVANRFELVVVAAERARQIAAGSRLLVERNNDKNPVVALREIAEDLLSIDALRKSALKGFKPQAEAFDSEEELNQLFAEEQERSFEQSLTAGAQTLSSGEAAAEAEEDEEDEALPDDTEGDEA